MNRLKVWLADFPGQNGGVVTALFLILCTGLTVIVKLAMGQPFPDGYDSWLLLLAALAGVNTIGMIGKRVTDIGYKQAGTSPVNVEAPSNVTVTAVASSVPPQPSVPVLNPPTEASD